MGNSSQLNIPYKNLGWHTSFKLWDFFACLPFLPYKHMTINGAVTNISLYDCKSCFIRIGMILSEVTNAHLVDKFICYAVW